MFLHVSVCPQEGWYPSMPCRSPGPHPGVKLRGLARGSPGLHPGGRLRGLAEGVSRLTPGGSPGPHWGSPGPDPGGVSQHSLRQTSPSPSRQLLLRAVRILLKLPLDLENLENLEKWEYTWKTWKYHGILRNLINIMEKWHGTWKNLVATKNSPLTPLKQCKIHKITEVERKVYYFGV